MDYLSSAEMFQIQFNTSFIQNGGYIRAGINEISPEKVKKKKILPDDFMMYIWLEDFCKVCDPYKTTLDELCKECISELGTNELFRWQ